MNTMILTTKKTLTSTIRRLSAAMFLGATIAIAACDGNVDPVAPEAMPGNGEPLSAEMQATIEANDDFQALRAQLVSHGDNISLDQGVMIRQDAAIGVFFPVEHAASGAGEYQSLVYQEVPGLAPSVSLELTEPNEDGSVAEGFDFPATQPQGPVCDAWGPWYTISTYCTWHIVCFGDATMLVRERKRLCHATPNYYQYESTTVRNRCGC